MVGMRFKAFSTAEDWSLPDRLRGRISVHRGAAQWPHFLRDSSAWSATGLTGSPSRSVMTVPQSGQAATSPWRVRRWVKTGFQWKPIRILTRPRTKNSWPVGCTPNCSRSLMSLTSVSGPLSTHTLAPATVSWISRRHL